MLLLQPLDAARRFTLVDDDAHVRGEILGAELSW